MAGAMGAGMEAQFATISSGIEVRRSGLRVHPWRALHVAQGGAALLQTITLQAAAGMRPQVLTLDGLADPDMAWASAQPTLANSLLSAWHDVRTWRDVLVANGGSHYEVVHAHSFSAGMAAVRNCAVVVYEITDFVEQLAMQASEQSGSEKPGAWLSRSLRVAEQFVIARSGAMIVHSFEHRAGALERGADADDVFVIPVGEHNLSSEEIARRYDEAYHHASSRRENGRRGGITMNLAPVRA